MADANSPRNIVLCSDGTGQRGGPGRRSNVWRTYLAVDPKPEGGPWQIRFHDDGVGSQDFAVFRILGGALGVGISRNIRELYAALVTSYRPEDRIFLFGFSRGAYTVRVLANLICLFGIPDGSNKTPRQILSIAQLALDSYKTANVESSKSHPGRDRGYTKAAEAFHNLHGNVLRARPEDEPFSVHFLGCWDTVGAIGLPFDELTKAVMPLFPLRFQNTRPPSGVQHLCQALAIDEERRSFQPEIWDESTLVHRQTVDQVWFPGVHSNVGGGYPKDQLALECLKWMVQQAESRGLKFNPNVLANYAAEASPHGKMYDSRAGLASYYRYRPRRIDRLMPGNSNPKIHASALDRIAYRAVAYAPTAITSRDYETVGSPQNFNPPFESDRQKDHRIASIEAAHDYIALNWVCYYLFFFWTALFLILGIRNASNTAVAPLIKPPDASGTEPWRALLKGIYSLEHQILDGASAILPGLVAPVIRGYENVPGMFLLLSILLVVLLCVSRRILAIKRDVATCAWQPYNQISTSEVAPLEGLRLFHRLGRMFAWGLDAILGFLSRIAGWFRRTPVAQWLSTIWVEHAAAVAGWGMIGAAVFLGLFAGTRHAWQGYHRYELGTYQFGQPVERPTSVLAVGEQRSVLLDSKDFNVGRPYFPTGVFVIQGQRYQVKVNQALKWQDASLPASPDGLDNEADEMVLHDWLKRDRDARVFTLMAAIGPDANHRTAIGREGKFTATVSGPLYLFVNDVPGFYHNNVGTASISISRLAD